MRVFLAIPFLALFPFASAAVAGGRVCQLSASAVPTPGLADLVTGSSIDPVTSRARLTEAQLTTLADLDTKLRKTLQGIESRAARLPAGARGSEAPNADVAHQPLPELVTRLVADATRDQAIVLDLETAPEFRFANTGTLDTQQRAEKAEGCLLCLAVRRGVESGFAWKAGELGALSPEQQKDAAELASARDEVRRTWTSALAAELNPEQLALLRKAQMRWLESTLHGEVAGRLRALGTTEHQGCSTTAERKCGICSTVLDAVGEAKSKS